MKLAQLKFALAGGAHKVVLIACLAIVGLLALAAAVTWQGSGEAAFPGEIGKIAFARNNEIYVMNADGSGATNITNNAVFDGQPAWSPDGTKIAFFTNRDSTDEIYVMSADGSDPTRLTFNTESDEYPAWSPDGAKIVFTSARDGNKEIYVVNADGSGLARLTAHPANDKRPAWSPDGKCIPRGLAVCPVQRNKSWINRFHRHRLALVRPVAPLTAAQLGGTIAARIMGSATSLIGMH